MPELLYFNKLSQYYQYKVNTYYTQYILNVSNENMAISFDSAKFLFILCNILKPKSILDLGSGFTSFLFRFYMQKINTDCVVWSIDDSPD